MDLIDRLRTPGSVTSWAEADAQRVEAAAEIERLRGTLKAQDKAHHIEVQEQVAAERERIARQWDGCIYDGVGETLDIGASIRFETKHNVPMSGRQRP